jgi:hypothetical protein
MFAPLTRKRRKPSTPEARQAKAAKAGKAGKGTAKRRGDEAYYKALSQIANRARWNTPNTEA